MEKLTIEIEKIIKSANECEDVDKIATFTYDKTGQKFAVMTMKQLGRIVEWKN